MRGCKTTEQSLDKAALESLEKVLALMISTSNATLDLRSSEGRDLTHYQITIEQKNGTVFQIHFDDMTVPQCAMTLLDTLIERATPIPFSA